MAKSKWLEIEKHIMQKYNMQQQPGSGNGWVHKEDGKNDYIMAQLKCTETQTIKLSIQDVDQLFYNSQLSRRTPLFINYIPGKELTLFSVRPNDIIDIAFGIFGEQYILERIDEIKKSRIEPEMVTKPKYKAQTKAHTKLAQRDFPNKPKKNTINSNKIKLGSKLYNDRDRFED